MLVVFVDRILDKILFIVIKLILFEEIDIVMVRYLLAVIRRGFSLVNVFLL